MHPPSLNGLQTSFSPFSLIYNKAIKRVRRTSHRLDLNLGESHLEGTYHQAENLLKGEREYLLNRILHQYILNQNFIRFRLQVFNKVKSNWLKSDIKYQAHGLQTGETFSRHLTSSAPISLTNGKHHRFCPPRGFFFHVKCLACGIIQIINKYLYFGYRTQLCNLLDNIKHIKYPKKLMTIKIWLLTIGTCRMKTITDMFQTHI